MITNPSQWSHATFTIAVASLFCSRAAGTLLPATFISPCECKDTRGKGRLTVKNGPSTPPIDAGAVESVAPPDVYSWPGPDVCITWHSERTGIENTWFTLTGRVVAVQVEADGDLHVELGDATDRKPGIIVCEIPAGPRWCEIRKTIFSWTRTRFPLHIRSTRELTINETPIITVIGKAFWDVGHAPKNQSNRRKRLPQYAVLEIHPVMVLHVVQ